MLAAKNVVVSALGRTNCYTLNLYRIYVLSGATEKSAVPIVQNLPDLRKYF